MQYQYHSGKVKGIKRAKAYCKLNRTKFTGGIEEELTAIKYYLMNKVLVIDDDEDISAMLFLLLRKSFDVAVVTNSEDIFPQLKTFQPDIILLDVFLTGYDGRIICKQLKFHPASKHIPIIMVSGNDEILQTVVLFGANDYLQKPFGSEALLLKINNLVRKIIPADLN